LRTKVFLAALDLQAAFILGAARILYPNLRTAMEMLKGQLPGEIPPAVIGTAWQSLFLVVPVVSTTFASVPRLFSHLGREALGWLFIDEAGQAPPQDAAGAIWRSRRVVAVGDPLQLEPILSTLFTTQQAIRRHHGVDETWLPARTSVQGLTDRVTPIGTWLPGPDTDPVWVGAPLKIHRRCDEPMFGIVNRLAYDGMMIQATPPRTPPLDLLPSRWVDVVATHADGNWIPDEGRAVDQIIEYLLKHDVEPANIFAISPFRDAAHALRTQLAAHPGLKAGTIHTTQGQERDIVLLVLGGGTPGARSWAAQRPNLLNVAVSRAKQRLYVIGNHDLWAKQPHFNTLARRIDVHPWTPKRRYLYFRSAVRPNP